MKNRLVSTRDLAGALEHQLRLPPSGAGMRLKPERELARHLGVNRMRVRRSLEQLVGKGILVRKQGSGIYVRKVPKDSPPCVAVAADHRKLPRCAPLFAKPVCDTRLHPPSDSMRLHLGMWGFAEMPNESGRSILRGIMDQARELGHRMVLYPMTPPCNDPLAMEKLTRKLREDPCDGHIVLTPLAKWFSRGAAEHRSPIVYVWGSNAEQDFQPLVQIDMDGALVRALRLLANEEYERIGLIGLDSLESRQRPLYEETLSKLGRTWQAAEFCAPDRKAVASLVRRIFGGKDSPQAIYVADDIVMRNVVPALKAIGRVPGENLGLITYANRGNPLPGGVNWSRLEFDPYSVGRIAVQSLLREIATAGEQLLSFSHQAAWRTGDTHRINRCETQ